jgi:hypothetical protein
MPLYWQSGTVGPFYSLPRTPSSHTDRIIPRRHVDPHKKAHSTCPSFYASAGQPPGRSQPQRRTWSTCYVYPGRVHAQGGHQTLAFLLPHCSAAASPHRPGTVTAGELPLPTTSAASFLLLLLQGRSLDLPPRGRAHGVLLR